MACCGKSLAFPDLVPDPRRKTSVSIASGPGFRASNPFACAGNRCLQPHSVSLSASPSAKSSRQPRDPHILLLLAAIALVALTLLALRRSLRLAVLPVAALWITAGLWAAQIQPAPSPQTALLAYADGLSRTVQGRIVRIRNLARRTNNTRQPR